MSKQIGARKSTKSGPTRNRLGSQSGNDLHLSGTKKRVYQYHDDCFNLNFKDISAICNLIIKKTEIPRRRRREEIHEFQF
jgi:hypothetical protein